MKTTGRVVVLGLLSVAVFGAGMAAAGVDLRKVILKPGHCITVAKVRICAAKAKTKTKTVTRTSTVTNTATSTVTAPPVTVTAPPVTVTQTVYTTPAPKIAFSDGTYRVGADIQAGTYRSTVTSTDCYWARLRGFGGTLDDIIANYIGNSPTIVTIAATDVGFESDRCGGWEKIG
jgi:hypothetical protein